MTNYKNAIQLTQDRLHFLNWLDTLLYFHTPGLAFVTIVFLSPFFVVWVLFFACPAVVLLMLCFLWNLWPAPDLTVEGLDLELAGLPLAVGILITYKQESSINTGEELQR